MLYPVTECYSNSQGRARYRSHEMASAGNMLVFHGTLAHSTWTTPLEILEDRLIGIEDGKIKFVSAAANETELMSEFSFSTDDIVALRYGEFLLPGFVDTHVHAPQYLNIGKGLDLTLLDWLDKYTFPVEAKFKDTQFASDAYQKAVWRLLRNGTTTACYFGTIHLDATLKLCDVIGAIGQRAYVGKVCMNCNSPEYYSESKDDSVQLSERFVTEILARKNPLITPILTPRFIITCTMELLKKLADLARQYKLPIQSHLNETIAECEANENLFPGYHSATNVFDDAGLLTERTVMAHGVYLDDDDIRLLKTRQTAIAHCPNSNTSLRSGLCNVRRLLDNGIKVGLGTDVSGGYHPSVLDAIRQTVAVSNAVGFSDSSNEFKRVDYREAFRLATLGGSQALGLQDKIGNFEVGKDFDALRINTLVQDSPFDVSSDCDSTDDIVQKFLYMGDDRNIVEVYVAGKRVHRRF